MSQWRSVHASLVQPEEDNGGSSAMGGVGRWGRNIYFQLAAVRAGYKLLAITVFTLDISSSPPTKQQVTVAGQSCGKSSLLDLFI